MRTLAATGAAFLAIAFSSALAPTRARSEELPARGPIPFPTYDKDGNGLISKDEFDAVRGERMATRAAEGRPMRGAGAAPAFSDFDTNGDGQLTQDELVAGQKKQMEQRRGMGMGTGQGMGAGMGPGRNLPAFSDYDLDGDGKIVEKEFIEARAKRVSERAQQGYAMRNLGSAPAFAEIDRNHDGQVDATEFAEHQSQQRSDR